MAGEKEELIGPNEDRELDVLFRRSSSINRYLLRIEAAHREIEMRSFNMSVEDLRRKVIEAEKNLESLRHQLQRAEDSIGKASLNRRAISSSAPTQCLHYHTDSFASFSLDSQHRALERIKRYGCQIGDSSEGSHGASPHPESPSSASTPRSSYTSHSQDGRPLDLEEYKRYGRQMIVPSVGFEGQAVDIPWGRAHAHVSCG